MNILIVGAAGNLGSHLALRLLATPHRLRLLTHRTAFPFALPENARAELVRADLNEPDSLPKACADIDAVVYLAGVLFQPHPEKFLHRTNTIFVQNITDAAGIAGVKKFVLVSFPHVEENTTPDHPAKGILNAHPQSIHGRTRLDAEKYLVSVCERSPMRAIVLRAGVIYGRGIKLIEAAHWLARKRLLAVWRKPTWIHLLALADFLNITELAVTKDGLSGIYNIADDQPLLLQEFLQRLTEHWGEPAPWRLPEWTFLWTATLVETAAALMRHGTPLTGDMMKMAMMSVVADTSRMKREILPALAYPTLTEGLKAL